MCFLVQKIRREKKKSGVILKNKEGQKILQNAKIVVKLLVNTRKTK